MNDCLFRENRVLASKESLLLAFLLTEILKRKCFHYNYKENKKDAFA